VLVGDVIRSLTFDKAASWDPVGLQLGDLEAEANAVAVCHEVTEQVMADTAPVDLLITYHPLLFGKVNKLVAGPGAAGRAYRLIRNEVSLAVVHTAWDVAPGGTADALAAELGLSDVRGFGLVEPPRQQKLITFVPPDALDAVSRALVSAGAGTIGRYRGCTFRSQGIGTFFPGMGAKPVSGRVGQEEEADELRLEVLVTPGGAGAAVAALLSVHPYEEPAFDLIETVSNAGMLGRIGTLRGGLDAVVATVNERFGPEARVSAPKTSGSPDSTGKVRVAVVPGSGGSMVGDAAAAGADVLVTGDLSHHETIAALDAGMATIDVGHARSEQPGMRALLDLVGRMVPDVIDLTFDPTPWR
jgi:dinuclear metal center YbgI/SA1388 family protein